MAYIKFKELSKYLNKCIENLELSSITKTTNKDGFVKFDNLQLGLYLVKQTNKVEGYSNIDPFLVAIPKEENNMWIYDIKATPKTDVIRLIDIIVEKKWDTINNTGDLNYFLINTSELVPGNYFIDIRIKTKFEQRIFKDVLRFSKVNNITNITR